MARAKLSTRYSAYMRSPAWFALRAAHLERFGAYCKACMTTTKPLHLHHKTYAHLGAELAAELVLLCDGCHRAVHKYARAHRELTLWQSTDHVVKKRRGR